MFKLNKVVLTAVVQAPPKGIYVAKNGSDSNPGTYSAPYLTIQKAADVAQPGDSVYIRSGIYYENVVMQTSGTEGNMIKFCGYRSEEAIIDGTGVTTYGEGYGGLFDTNEKDYLHIENLTIQKVNGTSIPEVVTTKNGFGIGQAWKASPVGSDHIIVRNCRIYYTSNSAIFFWKGHDILIEDCVCHHNAFYFVAPDTGGEEIITVPGTSDVIIRNNVVAYCENNVLGGEGIDAKTGCSNVKIYGNTIHDLAKVGIYADGYDVTCNNVEICNNKIYNCSGGISIAAEETPGNITNINVHHNEIYAVDDGIAIGWTDTGYLQNVSIHDNNIHDINSGGNSVLIDNSHASNSGLSLTNNILDITDCSGIYGANYDAADWTISGNTTDSVETP